MRHIPKLAAIIGSVTIGILGFQGFASATNAPANVPLAPVPANADHHKDCDLKHGGDGDHDCDDGYPGPTTTTTEEHHHHHHHGHGHDVDTDGKKGGFKLASG
jgi:hypothetical protein